MALRMDKDRTINISIASLVAFIGTCVSVWAFSTPIIKSAMAGEIKEQIAPLNNAFIVILLQNIQNQKNAVTAMVFKKETSIPGTWTLRDEQDLQAQQDSLTAMIQALKDMQRAQRDK